MMGRKAVFGRHGRARGASKPILRASADRDGVARVLPRELWDDPRTASFLREMGLAPDDAHNLLPDPYAYYRDRFATARAALDARIAALAATIDSPDGSVWIEPLLVIDLPLWRGRFGTLLYETMGLVAWDDWNVVMLAGDEAAAAASGLPVHPGTIPALNVRVTEALHAIATRLDGELSQACAEGCPPTGHSRAHLIEIETRARDRLLDFAAVCRSEVEALLGDPHE